MSTRFYICSIYSDSSYGIERTVSTRSAKTCGLLFGKCEPGEQIIVRTRSGKVMSKAIWSPEQRKYISVNV